MDISPSIVKELENCRFKVSTDTRKDVAGSLYFALKGENFDGSAFIGDALEKGAVGAVTENPDAAGDNVYLVESVLKTLQESAKAYRAFFEIPVIAIGGSNGKTTSRELVNEVLKKKYNSHCSKENLNNHIGVPLSILSMDRKSEIGIFELGANHAGEHSELLEILRPTMVVVTNNGLDHLEGFGSPEGVRDANKEIYDWAREHGAGAFVNENLPDLMEDSEGLERVPYPVRELNVSASIPLTFEFEGKECATRLVGDYNMDNIHLALAVGECFNIPIERSLDAICRYEPSLKRSQFVNSGGIGIILDCYNANPSSMRLALESFFRSAKSPRAVVLGDMLEMGRYSEEEHKKIVEYVSAQKPDVAVFVGEDFKKALAGADLEYQWFPDSASAGRWFREQDFKGFTVLLKGSRGMAVEKALDM